MDLVTLVTACALSVEPKLMHALIWHQSGGELWAVAVQNEPMPRVYSSMQEAVSEAHSAAVMNDTVRVGLAGLPVSPLKVNAAMFLPCQNVAIAAKDRQTRRSVQGTSTSQSRSKLLCRRRLSRLMATTGCQIRGSGSSDRCERGRSQLRYTERCKYRIARHWSREPTAVE
jgi:hypothetical protein